jgi:hypothetical protein
MTDSVGTVFLIVTMSDNFFLLTRKLSRRDRFEGSDTEKYNGKKISRAPGKTGVFLLVFLLHRLLKSLYGNSSKEKEEIGHCQEKNFPHNSFKKISNKEKGSAKKEMVAPRNANQRCAGS